MRNLKKILALVLALIMSLSLMATAGATGFKDDADVSDTYRQAVEVLSELGVFNGDQNGQFNPGQPIKRSEVAAIIYRIATGDVTNERNNTYTPYNQFPDVIAGDWYAGYVTYCANAGYIKGRNDGKFDPKADVTGYEVLAMILRAVGYDKNNEFVGSDWQLNTASLATQMGVLKNITNTTSLKEAATREVVAELLFQAMLLPQVNWNAATLSYDANRETLAYENLGLEELQGVVMANKWADLESDTVLKDGLTRLDVDGKDYVLEIDTPIAAIGEMRHAYVQNGAKVIGNLTEGDLENPGVSIVAEPENNGGQASKVADIARGGNIRLTADTEYFVNFGEGECYTSEWQIRYEVTFATPEAKAHFSDNYIDPDEVLEYDAERELQVEDRLSITPDGKTYVKTIRAGMEITGFDMLMMQGILGSADDLSSTNPNGITGYVRRVAESTVTDWNVTNQGATTYYSWARFFAECIVNNATNYTTSDNGEWLKIIDKDGDGDADYVLRTDFVMTVIEDIVRDADKNITAYRMEYKNPVTGKNVDLPVDEIAYDNDPAHGVAISEEDMIEGAVILYTYIDGVYHVASPRTASKAVAKSVDLRNETATFTIDGADEERGWSGIERKDASRKSDITSVERGISYTLYYDHFGYVRLFEESSKGFVLLTDGYYATDRRDDVYKATIYNDETGKLEDVDVADSNRGDVKDRDINAGFINPTEDAAINSEDHETTQTGHGNASTWERLNTFGFYNYNLSGAFTPVNATAGSVRYGDATANPYIRFQQAFETNVAAFVETEDGYELYDVNAANTEGDQVTTEYHAYTLITKNTSGVEDAVTGETLTATAAAPGARTLWGVKTWKDTNSDSKMDAADVVQRIHTTANTKYYWVVGHGLKATVVSWDGFSVPNGIEWDPTEDPADVAYVVTSSVSVNDKRTAYETAVIVVFEGSYEEAGPDAKSGVIAVKGNRLDGKNNAMRSGEYQLVKPTILYTMGWNGNEDLGDYASYDVNVPGSYADDTGNSYYHDDDLLDFYTYSETASGRTVWDKVTSEWYRYHFYAGYVVDERGTDAYNDTGYGYLNRALDQDLIDIADPTNGHPAWHGNTVRYDRMNVPVYKFTTVTNDRNRVGYDFEECELTYGDMVLYLTDGDTRNGEKAMMIWNVTESIKEGNEEIIRKLIGQASYDFDDPLSAMTGGLWNDVRKDYEGDRVTNAGKATIKFQVVDKDNGKVIDVAPNGEIRYLNVSDGRVDVTVPNTTDIGGWDYTVPAGGATSGDIDVEDAAGNEVEWVILNPNTTLRLQGVAADKTYTVTLKVAANTNKKNTVSITGTATRISAGSDVVLHSNETDDVYFAVATGSDLTITSNNAKTTWVYETIEKADLPDAVKAAVDAASPAYDTGYTFYKVTLKSAPVSTTETTSLTVNAIASYDMDITNDDGFADAANAEFTPESAANPGEIDAGTALNTIKIYVDVDEGYRLVASGLDTEITLIEMGTTRLDRTITYDGNRATISITSSGNITGNITVTLRTEAVEDESIEEQAAALGDLTVERDMTVRAALVYDFVLDSNAENGTEYIYFDVPADTNVELSGDAVDSGYVTEDHQPNPFVRTGSGTDYHRLTINKTQMKLNDALEFTLLIGEMPAPSITATAAHTATGADEVTAVTGVPAATLSGTEGLDVEETTAGAVDAKAVYTVDFSGVTVSEVGMVTVTINGAEFPVKVETASAAGLATAVQAALDGQIADGINSGKYVAAVSNTSSVTFTASENSADAAALETIAVVAGPAIPDVEAAAAVADKWTFTIGTFTAPTSDTTYTVTVKNGETEAATGEITITSASTPASVAAAIATAISTQVSGYSAANTPDETTVTLTQSTAGAVDEDLSFTMTVAVTAETPAP